MVCTFFALRAKKVHTKGEICSLSKFYSNIVSPCHSSLVIAGGLLNMASHGITHEQIRSFQENFARDPRNRLARNAVTKSSIQSVALNREVVAGANHTFSHMLKSNDATAQSRSGRCWLFAGLNLFRVEAMKRLNVDKFELSQSYLMFWDKLEKANYFLETILATLDEPANGRLLMFLLQQPLQDGGQWDMFVNLVEKYGVVPKSVMPEAESSGNTGAMTSRMTTLLREDAAELRRMYASGVGIDDLRERKQTLLGDFYRMLCIHLGEPPQSFAWQWRDKDNAFHRDGELTPAEFYRRYVDYDLSALACLIHCPTADKPLNRLYTIQHLDLYDYSVVYGVDFKADKAERVDYGHSLMTHAMVFTGVDLDDAGRPLKWRVENSWGDKIGDKGFLVMSDGWFEQYLYEIVVDKRFIPKELVGILETDPIVLPPWDPMGALA